MGPAWGLHGVVCQAHPFSLVIMPQIGEALDVEVLRGNLETHVKITLEPNSA